MNVSLSESIAAVGVSVAVGLFAQDQLAAAAVLVLLIGLKLTSTPDGSFVLPAAFAFHWSQTSLGVLYLALTGRQVPAVYQSEYRPMVAIALGCCLALSAGIWIGRRLLRTRDAGGYRPEYMCSFSVLAAAYIGATAFEGTLLAKAVEYPSVRQILVSLDAARLGLLFLVLRRLFRPVTRWVWIAGILVFEVGLGITGFFAGFREPVVLASLATIEIFERRNLRHWAALAAAMACAVGLGLLWMGIRVDYRREYVDIDSFQRSREARANAIVRLGTEWLQSDAESIWFTADRLVDRMWAVYYPALALKRVPDVLPYTNGEILRAALVHLATPRVFFPAKPELPSDSEKVRRYANVIVAGPEQNTSIAFGYAIESYIDFGLPAMFAPVFLFGIVVGAAYAFFNRLIFHRELSVAFCTVAFWVSLYLYERSWATMLGIFLGMMVYLGIPIIVVDRLLLAGSLRRDQLENSFLHAPEHPSTVA